MRERILVANLVERGERRFVGNTQQQRACGMDTPGPARRAKMRLSRGPAAAFRSPRRPLSAYPAPLDPNLLRQLTDPEARKDPAKMRAMASELRKASRRTILSSLRTNSVVMGTAGWIFLAVAFAAATAFLVRNLRILPAALEVSGDVAIIVCPLFAVLGGAFVLFARMTSLPPRSLLRNGVCAEATVREVKALGRTLGIEKPGISATASRVTLVLSVRSPGASAFDTVHNEFIVGADLRHLQVGSTVPLRVDPRNPKRLAIDWDAID
jgi:hypothetical protein